jgi:hypothetical protein
MKTTAGRRSLPNPLGLGRHSNLILGFAQNASLCCMQLPKVEWQAYYKRLWRQLLSDLFRQGGGQVIGVLLALVILVFQLHYGLIPQGTLWFQICSVGWPYLGLMVLLCLWCMGKAPVALDNERINHLNENDTTIEMLRNESAKLRAAIAKPPRAPAQQHYYERLKTAIQEHGQLVIQVMRYLRGQKQAVYGGLKSQLPDGMSENEAVQILQRLREKDIVVYRPIATMGGQESLWEISSEMEPVVDEVLYPDSNS